MYEEEKIAEAEYFYSRMKQEQNDRTGFRYNLSAFLSAARSVLQYALEEARTKPGGKQWYDSQVSNHATIRFFKDKRDINIHVSPVNLRQQVDVNVVETVRGVASISYVVFDRDGKVKGQGSDAAPEPSKELKGSVSVTNYFFFDDWAGIEDVVTICGNYLDTIKNLAEDGKRKGFLS
ncbi:MAG: hypothetical protein AABN95_08375 [Acidobacteriota bacterium]